MDELLLTSDERLEEVDGVALVWGEEGVALDRQEVVPTSVVSRRVVTYTSRLERYLAAKVAADIVCRAASAFASTIDLFFLIIVTASSAQLNESPPEHIDC